MLLSYFFTVDFTVGDCKMFIQGYTVFKFYPLSFKYRDPAASPLNARQCMLENQAIKLINRQFNVFISVCLRLSPFRVTQFWSFNR